MKKSIFILFAVLTSAITFTAFKPATDAKVIAIVNKADWCSICKANGERFVTQFTTNNLDNYFQLIANDITNSETKKTSSPAIKTAGLEKTQATVMASGVVTFYDATSKKVLAQFTVANSNDEFKFVMNSLRK